MRKHLLPALALLTAVGCTDPAYDELFVQRTLQIAGGPAGGDGRAENADAWITLIDGATESLFIGIPAGDDTEIAEAIVNANDRGVLVEVVTDYDERNGAGVRLLRDNNVPVKLADEGLTYFDFSINGDVVYTSAQTQMSSAYLIADEKHMALSTSAGRTADGARITFLMDGEDIKEDLWLEHNQLYGDADAVAVTRFDAPAKSIADIRWIYPGVEDAPFQLWMGPQERLTKRLIDAIYGARSNVWILTNDFSNDGMAKALQDKAERGFDIKVVVGADFGAESPAQASSLENDSPDVQKRQVSYGEVPTLILVDTELDREGFRPMAHAYVLTHDLYSSSRLYDDNTADDNPPVPVMNDQLIDGMLYQLDDPGARNSDVQALIDLFNDHFDDGGAL